MKIPEFKYTTRFDVGLRSCPVGGDNNAYISQASIQNLWQLLPSQHIDLGKNIDLMGVAFDAAIVNQFNRNDDGMDSITASQVAPYFIHKPTNIEHDKKKIVGHIVTAGFTTMDNHFPMSKEELLDTKDLVHLSLGAVVYRLVDPKFTDLLLKATTEGNPLFNTVCASWELGFNDFVIAVGSQNVKEAEIITNPKQIEELRKKLKAYGGNGKMDDGTRIYRLVKGEVFPQGIGFTGDPAANVRGVLLDEGDRIEKMKVQDSRDAKVFSMYSKIISQFKSQDVNNTKSMDLEKFLSELKDCLQEKKFSQEAIASMTDTFADAIRQKDDEFRAAKAEKDASETRTKELLASVDQLKQELSDTKVKLQSIEATQEAERVLARFNERMEQIDSVYALEDEDRKVIADELKSVTTDEAFASYQGKLAIVLKHKNKEHIARVLQESEAKINAEVEKRVAALSTASTSTASTKTEAELTEEALAKAKVEGTAPPNNNGQSGQEGETFKTKFAKAFSRENVLVQ